MKVAQSLWGAGQMMFNKYLLVVPSGTDVRDSDALARLLRRIDPVRDLSFPDHTGKRLLENGAFYLHVNGQKVKFELI